MIKKIRLEINKKLNSLEAYSLIDRIKSEQIVFTNFHIKFKSYFYNYQNSIFRVEKL